MRMSGRTTPAREARRAPRRAPGRPARLLAGGFLAALAALAAGGCGGGEDVVLYCALDQVFSEPILHDFEVRTGLSVKAVFDVEASKSVGLTTTILEERGNPSCDVFWNNEIANTIRLQDAGALAPYRSPAAEGIPDTFRDPEGYWTGFAARARVLLVNTDLVPEGGEPRGLAALVDPAWRGQGSIARPLAGTTLTHVAALFATWGEERTRAFLDGLVGNETRIVSGNAQVMRLVSGGDAAFGLTDTDDASVAVAKGSPVRIVLPDQGEGEEGTLVIPNTIALVANGPHPESGKRLIDFLLSREIEARLAAGPSRQIPLHAGVEAPAGGFSLDSIRATAVDFRAVAREVDGRADELRRRFLR